MTTLTYLLLFVFAVQCYIEHSDAIRCYQCDVNTDAQCADGGELDENYIKTKDPILNQDCQQCIKQKVKYGDDQLYLVRTCLSVAVTSEDTCADWEYLGNKGDSCTCTTDLCNGSSHMTFSVVGLVTMVILIAFLV